MEDYNEKTYSYTFTRRSYYDWTFSKDSFCLLQCNQKWSGKRLVTLCTSGGSGLGRSGSDLAKFAKDADFKGGKDFTRGSGAAIKKYVEGLLK